MLRAHGHEMHDPGQWPIQAPWDVTTPLTHLRVLQHLGIKVSGLAASLPELRRLEVKARRKLGQSSTSAVRGATSDA
jgi:hypothetical protein